jgi:hypothetical protein
LFGNIDLYHDFEYHHDFCEGTVANPPTKPYPFVAIGGRSSGYRSEDIDSGDDNANGEFGKISQVGSEESAAEAADDQDHAEAESIEGSQEEATNSQTLSQLLGATTLGDSDSEGYASDDHANNTSAPPPLEQNTCSSPGTSSYSDMDQDSSSEAESFYEDSDHEAYDQNQSDNEMDEEEAEYLSDLCEFDDDTADRNASNVLTPPMTTSGRRRLTTEERELVRQTREIGACVRCRFQKIKVRCSPGIAKYMTAGSMRVESFFSQCRLWLDLCLFTCCSPDLCLSLSAIPHAPQPLVLLHGDANKTNSVSLTLATPKGNARHAKDFPKPLRRRSIEFPVCDSESPKLCCIEAAAST